jgi:hypothetical protein
MFFLLVQEMKNHQLDKVNPGAPLADDIENLQVCIMVSHVFLCSSQLS